MAALAGGPAESSKHVAHHQNSPGSGVVLLTPKHFVYTGAGICFM